MTSASLAQQPVTTADADADEADRYQADIPSPGRRQRGGKLANAASLAAHRCADCLARAANTAGSGKHTPNGADSSLRGMRNCRPPASGGKHMPNGADTDAPDQSYGDPWRPYEPQ